MTMKTIKVAKATERQLNWLVARIEGDELPKSGGKGLDYSSDWAHGGPIIEREVTRIFRNVGGTWSAMILKYVPIPPEDRGTSLALTQRMQWNAAGPTALIAAMRCFCCSKLGDTVEVPDALTCSPTPKND